MTERQIIARALWMLRSLGFRLDSAYDVCRGPVRFRRFELRTPEAAAGIFVGRHEVRRIEAPLKAVVS